MLTLIRFSNGELGCLDFGRPLEPKLTTEQHIREILADFDRRKSELLDIGFSPAVQILIDILERSGNDAGAIIPPIRALGYLGRPQGAEAVGRHASHPDERVRLAVIRSLGQMGKFDSIPIVERFLSSNTRSERREAIIALGKFAKPELVPQLERAAGRDPELIRLVEEAKRRIEATVTGIRTNNFRPFVEALIDTDEYEDILAMFMVAWRPVIEILADRGRSPQVRQRALRLLVAARARRASEEMHKILNDPKEPLEMRLLAAEGLGRIKARSAVDRLVELLNSPEPGMQDRSIESLGRIGDSRSLSALLERWDERGGALRSRLQLAASRLCSTPGAESLLEPLKSFQPREIAEVVFISGDGAIIRGYQKPLIQAELKSGTAEARRDATLLLATFGTKADIETLQQIAKTDIDPLVRQIADLGLERLKDIPLWERP